MPSGSEQQQVKELRAVGLVKRYGGLVALDRLTLSVLPGQVHALLGPNGSGKTTALNVLSLAEMPTEGQVLLGGMTVTGAGRAAAASMGIARTHQSPLFFSELSVAEHCMLVGTWNSSGSAVRWLAGGPTVRMARTSLREILDALGLWKVRDIRAALLAYPQLKRLEVAAALSMSPTVLLLDEPASGSGPDELLSVCEVVSRARDAGVGIVVVDHALPFIERVADVVTVLDSGHVIASGGLDVLEYAHVRAALCGVRT